MNGEEFVHRLHDWRRQLNDDVVSYYYNDNEERGDLAFDRWQERFTDFLKEYVPNEASRFEIAMSHFVMVGSVNESPYDAFMRTSGNKCLAFIDDLIDSVQKGHITIKQKESVTSATLSSGANKEEMMKPLSGSTQLIDIFISHSSKDKDVAAALIELLRAALNIPADRIRCTSVDGYRLPAGASTDEQLRREIYDARAFIALLTPASLQSMYVLFELGARWGAGLHLAPMLASGASAGNLRAPLTALNTLSCDEPAQIYQLVDDLAAILKIHTGSPSSFQKHVNALIQLSGTGKEQSQHQSTQATGLAYQVLYDSRQGIDGFDFRGQEAQIWKGVGKDSKPVSPTGHGTLIREEGTILNVQRTNTDGRFEVWLQRFSYNGKDHPYIPKNLHISGKRRLRISFEAKAAGGEHTLRFVIRVEEGYRLAEDMVKVSASEWKSFEVFLQFDPTQDCQLRIDDEGVTRAPSSVQIRNIVVAEKKS